MGADLIGYHLVGPAVIKERRIERAKRRMRTLVRVMAMDKAKGMSATDRKIRKGIIQRIANETGNDDEGYLDAKAMELASAGESIVLDAVAAWDCAYSDSNGVTFGTRRAVFAGASTWGDTPDGAAYEAFQNAACAGILADLGLA